MKFGIQFSFVTLPGSAVGQREAYGQLAELVPLADALGYDAFHTTEHHFQPDGWCPSPLIVLAAVAGLTQRMRLVTNVLLVPLYEPMKLAEDVATLDNVSGGRVTLGVSPGYASEEFEGFRIARDERFRRFEETLDLLQLAWAGEPFSFDGEFFQIPETKLVPRPVQDPIPIWYGVSGPKLLRRAARRGCPVTASQRHTVAELKEHVARFDAALAEIGATVDERPVIREAFIADTTAEAERIAGPALTSVFELYERKAAAGERELRDDDGRLITDQAGLDFRSYRSRYIVGDPAATIKQIRALDEELHPTELILRMQLPGIPTAALRRSMELFAAEVMPAFSAS